MHRRLSGAEHPNNSSVSRWRYQKTSGNAEGARWRTDDYRRYVSSVLNQAIKLNDSDLLEIDVQNLLVGVGALKATDHRVVRPTRGDGEEAYSSIRTGRLHATTTEEEEDDWD